MGEAEVEVEIDDRCNIEDVVDRLKEKTTVTVAGAGCGIGVEFGRELG